jgi:hypothetical protein
MDQRGTERGIGRPGSAAGRGKKKDLVHVSAVWEWKSDNLPNIPASYAFSCTSLEVCG